jgi:prepilin-type processing-associated H-X9-DG protein
MAMIHTRRAGVSLTEWLVAVGAVAVVAAVLFPAICRQASYQQGGMCVSNEHKLATAMLQYAHDHDDNWPCSNTFVKGQQNQPAGWAGQIYPYVKSASVFQCPDDLTLPDRTGLRPKLPLSYALNRFLTLDACVQPSGSIKRSDDVTPANTVMFMEIQQARADLTNPAETDSPVTGGTYVIFNQGKSAAGTFPGRSWRDGATIAHGTGSNFAAADGHVVWLLPSKISGGYSNADRSDAPQSGVGSYDCASDPAGGGYQCPAGTASLDNGGGKGSAVLTFSTK